uniref:C4-dicarboxylic acid transporter DauA n=1 Tax=Marinospirillum sp. TaxID=2183934 RepID=UPI003A843270
GVVMSLPFATALRETFRQGYTFQHLRADLLAGITLGIIAIPLAMALAIASGVPPQHGLYTAMIAGAVIALSGGSRYSISGPTAAFIVLLLPVTQQFGLGGLLMATLMAGAILLVMGLLKMGRLIQFIPAPVILGFTSGIAIVIASLQLKDFFGLAAMENSDHFFIKLLTFVQQLPNIHWADACIGLVTLGCLILWPRLKTPLPGHLPALALGTGLALLGPHLFTDFAPQLLGDQFSWQQGELSGQGIPPFAPQLSWPWDYPNAQGEPIGFSWDLIQALLPAALTIALLGAIESLLCALVADSLAGSRHDPNAELIGQGLGNLVAPFFGGITATAALARTAANVRAGGHSPLAAVIHALVILGCILLIADWLAQLPMAALAGLLLMVAWNMSEAHHVKRMLQTAPRPDLLVLLTSLSLTVVFDMVIAVSVGLVLASLLFIARMAQLTSCQPLSAAERDQLQLPAHVAYFRLQGPLFFGSAEKALGRLKQVDPDIQRVIIEMQGVLSLDITAIHALKSNLQSLQDQHLDVTLIGLSDELIAKLQKAGMDTNQGVSFARSLAEARLE